MSVRATPPPVRATPPPVGAADVSASRTRLQQVLTVGLAHLELGEETGARLKKKKVPAKQRATKAKRESAPPVKKPHRYRPGDQPDLPPSLNTRLRGSSPRGGSQHGPTE